MIIYIYLIFNYFYFYFYFYFFFFSLINKKKKNIWIICGLCNLTNSIYTTLKVYDIKIMTEKVTEEKKNE